MKTNSVRKAGCIALVLAVLPFAISDANSDEREQPDAALVDEARTISKTLGKKLKSQLKAALTSDGPASALGVCNAVAPAIADELSKSYIGKVGRTALKVRNPNNSADEFEKTVLLDFVKKAAAGADVSRLEYAEVVAENGVRTFRYMKAIPMATTPCAACHGTVIEPEVRNKIQDLYPDDQAVGFKPGDIRGAFTIEKPLQ